MIFIPYKQNKVHQHVLRTVIMGEWHLCKQLFWTLFFYHQCGLSMLGTPSLPDVYPDPNRTWKPIDSISDMGTSLPNQNFFLVKKKTNRERPLGNRSKERTHCSPRRRMTCKTHRRRCGSSSEQRPGALHPIRTP